MSPSSQSIPVSFAPPPQEPVATPSQSPISSLQLSVYVPTPDTNLDEYYPIRQHVRGLVGTFPRVCPWGDRGSCGGGRWRFRGGGCRDDVLVGARWGGCRLRRNRILRKRDSGGGGRWGSWGGGLDFGGGGLGFRHRWWGNGVLRVSFGQNI